MYLLAYRLVYSRMYYLLMYIKILHEFYNNIYLGAMGGSEGERG